MDSRLFLAKPFQLSSPTQVIKARLRKGEYQVVLRESPFEPDNPEGGDRGRIEGPHGTLSVRRVVWDGNQKAAIHSGDLTGELHAGEDVVAKVDETVRRHNGAYHTVSHLLTSIARERWQSDFLGKLTLTESGGDLTLFGQAARAAANWREMAEPDRYLGADIPVLIYKLSRTEALNRCGQFFDSVVPDSVAEWRVVQFQGIAFPPIPCGGVHLPNLNVLRGVNFTRSRVSGDDLVLEYTCDYIPA
ncbi:MAG: hypothetical protein IT168_02345 [Bryobacterales bacterium]|nr:hypothetical protein [Bryobacterales bacterium]